MKTTTQLTSLPELPFDLIVLKCDSWNGQRVDFVCKVCKNHNLQIKHDRAQRKATIRVKQVASDYLNASCLMTHLQVTEMEMLIVLLCSLLFVI